MNDSLLSRINMFGNDVLARPVRRIYQSEKSNRRHKPEKDSSILMDMFPHTTHVEAIALFLK